MSYEFKMKGHGNGRKSRLYKKTKRASMNRMDASHLPNRNIFQLRNKRNYSKSFKINGS